MEEVTIKSVFRECQFNISGHSVLVKKLTKVYQATPFEDFFETFSHLMKYSLIVLKRETAVERTIDFITKFSTSLCVPKKDEKSKEGDGDEDVDMNEDEDEEEMHQFLLKLFSFLLKHHNANDKAVRFRCCQLVNKLLVSLGDDAQIDDDLYDRIYECMLQRLRDVCAQVRIQATLALTRLQDPQNKECPVISAYLYLLGYDPHPDVRRAVLSCIAATTKTLPAILERTRDTKDLVRKLAYKIIAEKVHIRALTIAQRVSLLKEGMNDRNDAVKDACTNHLLQSWLRIYQGNMLEVLKCLDVESSLEVSCQMLQALFAKFPRTELLDKFDSLNHDLTLPIEDIDCENVLYWRCLCEFIKAAGLDAEEDLEKILPTGSTLAKYIQTITDHMKAEKDFEAQLRNEFILQQILEICALLDFSDESGRRQIDRVMRSLLLSEHIMHTLVKPIVTVLELLHRDHDTRVAALVETISDIREPITVVENTQNVEKQRQRDLKMASIRVELNQLRDELDGTVQRQEFERAADIKAKITSLDQEKSQLLSESEECSASQEVRVEKNDPVTLLKCLTIVCIMLEDPAIHNLTATLQTLMEVVILPCIPNQEPSVRNAAIKALGLCCLLSRDKAIAHLLLFMQVTQVDQEGVKVSALKVLFDLLQQFGLEAFELDAIDENDSKLSEKKDETPFGEDDDDEGILNLSQRSIDKPEKEKTNTARSILNILVTLMESESMEVRTVAAEGLAKLMLSGRLASAKVMSRLLLLWYNPVTEDDAHLRHCLGAFFPIFSFAGKVNQTLLEESFLPTLRTLFDAPTSSPLAEINVDNVAELLTQLTCTRHLVNKNIADELEDTTPHDNLVISLSNEILNDPNSFNVRTLCKVLNMLEISLDNESLLKDIRVLSERLLKEVKEPQCCKMLEKFRRVTSDALKIIIQSRPHAGDGDLSSVDAQIEQTEAQLSRMEVDDVDNTELADEPSILPDGDGDTTGISLISKRSKIRKPKQSVAAGKRNQKGSDTLDETSGADGDGDNSVFGSPSPVKKPSCQAANTPNATATATKRSTRNTVDSPAVPSPVRRSTRIANSPATRASPTPTRKSTRATRGAGKKPAPVKETRKKLDEYLSESDASDGESASSVASNTSKSSAEPKSSTSSEPSVPKRRTRAAGRRAPLSDIENEVK